jgi:hypothetical protein
LGGEAQRCGGKETAYQNKGVKLADNADSKWN